MAGLLRSGFGCARGAKRGAATPSFSAHTVSSLVGVGDVAGWSASSSSTTIFCAWTARGLAEATAIPGVGVRQQAAASVRSP